MNPNEASDNQDMLCAHVESGWKHLVRAYNTAKNARKYDTAGSIAYAIAETSAVMEYLQAMSKEKPNEP